MSASNPAHRVQRKPWPFPVTLPAPGYAPDPKPVWPPSPDTSKLPPAPY